MKYGNSIEDFSKKEFILKDIGDTFSKKLSLRPTGDRANILLINCPPSCQIMMNNKLMINFQDIIEKIEYFSKNRSYQISFFDENFENFNYHIIQDVKKVEENSKDLYYIKVNKKVVDNIIKHHGKTNVKILLPNNEMESTFSYKNESREYYYYHCNKRPRCFGKCKYNKEKKILYITELCTDNSAHLILNYEELCDLLESNRLELVDFNIKKNQSNLVRYIFNHTDNVDNINIRSEYHIGRICSLSLFQNFQKWLG